MFLCAVPSYGIVACVHTKIQVVLADLVCLSVPLVCVQCLMALLLAAASCCLVHP
jgi:hypothetical protein